MPKLPARKLVAISEPEYDPVVEVEAHFNRFAVAPPDAVTTAAAWVVASHMIGNWRKFAVLAVNSPERECGKSTFLELLSGVVSNPKLLSSPSFASVYRMINQSTCTLLVDEAHSIAQKSDEDGGRQLNDLFCASTNRGFKVPRCDGPYHELKEFETFGPKVIACIGSIEPVLRSRCFVVPLVRKKQTAKVERYVPESYGPVAEAINGWVSAWAGSNAEKAKEAFAKLPPTLLGSDRVDDLMAPLFAVAEVTGNERTRDALVRFGKQMSLSNTRTEDGPPGPILIEACREIFARVKPGKDGRKFLSTQALIIKLCERDEEPWATIVRGNRINPEKLAAIFRPYEIRSERETGNNNSTKGYSDTKLKTYW